MSNRRDGRPVERALVNAIDDGFTMLTKISKHTGIHVSRLRPAVQRMREANVITSTGAGYPGATVNYSLLVPLDEALQRIDQGMRLRPESERYTFEGLNVAWGRGIRSGR